jgi:hypothetical protein
VVVKGRQVAIASMGPPCEHGGRQSSGTSTKLR